MMSVLALEIPPPTYLVIAVGIVLALLLAWKLLKFAVKVGIVAVAAFFLYRYLDASGYLPWS